EARHSEADETGIVTLAKRAPSRERRALVDAAQSDGAIEPGEAFHAEEGWMRGGDERREGGCGDAGDRLEDAQIVDPVGRPRVDLVVADDQPERLSSGGVERVAVDLSEELALVELERALGIASELLPRDVEELDPHAPALIRRVGLVDEPFDAAPGCLEPLKLGVVEDRVHLVGDLRVDRRDIASELADRRARARLRPELALAKPETKGLDRALLGEKGIDRSLVPEAIGAQGERRGGGGPRWARPGRCAGRKAFAWGAVGDQLSSGIRATMLNAVVSSSI